MGWMQAELLCYSNDIGCHRNVTPAPHPISTLEIILKGLSNYQQCWGLMAWCVKTGDAVDFGEGMKCPGIYLCISG